MEKVYGLKAGLSPDIRQAEAAGLVDRMVTLLCTPGWQAEKLGARLFVLKPCNAKSPVNVTVAVEMYHSGTVRATLAAVELGDKGTIKELKLRKGETRSKYVTRVATEVCSMLMLRCARNANIRP